MTEKEKNYYDILEISPSATQDDVYKGYLRAKSAYSGDNLALYSLMTDDECKKMIDLIEEAYSIIGDPPKRLKYNAARGILAIDSFSSQESISSLAEKMPGLDLQEKASSPMTNVVARKKFNLTFELDNEIENKIEQTQDFTGEFLKEIREYKKIDIKRLSEMTKISKTYLRNIEEENFEALPAFVYARGFVYQYAKCLKLNPDLVANSYMVRLKQHRA